MTVCTPWRVANSLNRLLVQFDTAWPTRSKASDGSIGDAAHQDEGACGSQHNSCCIRLAGIWIIRARDFTHDPARGADMARVSEEMRRARDPRVRYIIFNRRITGPSYGWAWAPYKGTNPHDKHMHVSVFDDAARFDSTAEWRIMPVLSVAQEVEMYAGTYFSASSSPNNPRFFGIPGVLCTWVQGSGDPATNPVDKGLSGLEDGGWIDPIAPGHSDGAAPSIDRSLINIVGPVPPGFEDRAAFKMPPPLNPIEVAHEIAVELAQDPSNPLTEASIPAIAAAVQARLGAALGTVSA